MQPLEWLTLGLLAMTAFYAWQTYRMAASMREARAIAVLPKVVPMMAYLVPDVLMPAVTNAGPGAALDVQLEMWLEPGKGHAREWRAPVLAPGETHQFFLKEGKSFATMTQLSERFTTLRVRGSCRNALGDPIDFDEVMPMSAWWRLVKESQERLQPDYPKKVSDALEKIAKAVQK